MTFSRVCACFVLAAAIAAQDLQLVGTVRDPDGAPLAGAMVAFEALPVLARPTPGTRGRYTLAQAVQRRKTTLPRTRTDRDGDWRIVLSPQQAALTDGSGVELAMRVSAPGHADWLRGIGTRIAAANGLAAVLPRVTPGEPRLRLKVQPAGARGFALVERAYRARDDTSLWLRALLPIDPGSGIAFDAPALVPGERPAARPTARAEGYRVTIYAAGCERLQRTFAEGEHEVRLEVGVDQSRRVLAERGEPARPPITATWKLGDEEVTLDFAEARVPPLGGEVPIRVQSASGPVLVDAWDPDVAMFVDHNPAPPSAPVGAGKDAPEGAEVQLRVTDGADQPLFGAVVWLEDAAARRMGLDPPPFAVTGADGTARLRGVPRGVFRALARHATAGEREILVDSSASAPVQVALDVPPVAAAQDPTEVAGDAMILFDLQDSTGEGERVEVGVMVAPGRLLVRSFDDQPQRVRVEGLPAGPRLCYVKSGTGPIRALPAVLAVPDAREAISPALAQERTFVLQVRTHDRVMEPSVYLSFGDGAPRGRKPYSAALLPIEYSAETGEVRLTLHTAGDLWVRVHGADGRAVDLLLPANAQEPLAVTLPPPTDPKAGEGQGRGR